MRASIVMNGAFFFCSKIAVYSIQRYTKAGLNVGHLNNPEDVYQGGSVRLCRNWLVIAVLVSQQASQQYTERPYTFIPTWLVLVTPTVNHTSIGLFHALAQSSG